MELEGGVLVSPTAEVPVIEGDVVTAIRTLPERGVGKKTIAREVGVAVNTVRRFANRSVIGGGTSPLRASCCISSVQAQLAFPPCLTGVGR